MRVKTLQPHLPQFEPAERRANGQVNQLDSTDQAFHAWYRFVLSFPAHLVRDTIEDFGLQNGQVVLDPFCGTGTTLVESKLSGFPAVGIEAAPFSHFASSVKVNWTIDPDALLARAHNLAALARDTLKQQGIDDSRPYKGNVDDLDLIPLDPVSRKLIINNSISPLPLHKTLVLLDYLERICYVPEYQHLLLAFAKALVGSISNLRFGPEIGVGKQKKDVPVVGSWLSEVERMASDLRSVRGRTFPEARALWGDARRIDQLLAPASIDAVAGNSGDAGSVDPRILWRGS
jgi:hypothetical protein